MNTTIQYNHLSIVLVPTVYARDSFTKISTCARTAFALSMTFLHDNFPTENEAGQNNTDGSKGKCKKYKHGCDRPRR